MLVSWTLLNEIKTIIRNSEISKNLCTRILSNYNKGETSNDINEKTTFEDTFLVEILLEEFDSASDSKGEIKNNDSDVPDIMDYFKDRRKKMVQKILEDNYVHKYLEVNIYKGVRYFNKERFNLFVKWLLNVLMLKKLSFAEKPNEVVDSYLQVFKYLIESAEESKYKLDELEDILIHKK